HLIRHDVDRFEGIVGDKPVSVSLLATIASENSVVSPISGQRAAFFHWDFVVECEPGLMGATHGVDKVRIALSSSWLGGDLELSAYDGRLMIPAQSYTVNFLHVGRPADRLDGPLPPSLSHISASPAASKGVMLYNEFTL